jgi:hypothetical protein
VKLHVDQHITLNPSQQPPPHQPHKTPQVRQGVHTTGAVTQPPLPQTASLRVTGAQDGSVCAWQQSDHSHHHASTPVSVMSHPHLGETCNWPPVFKKRWHRFDN